MLGRTRESLGPSRHAATPARFCPDVSATQGKVFFKLFSLDGDYADWRDLSRTLPGTTIVFKKIRRVQSWFEDWLHLGVNVAFLDFDSAQSLEVGMALVLTIYKDFFEIGYGRNLTVREDPWYWYIGLNVVHLPGEGG